MYNRSTNTILTYLPWLVALLGFVLLRPLFKSLKAGTETAGDLLGGVFGSPDGGDVEVKDTAGGSYDSKNTINEIKSLVDLIYEKLDGPNIYYYPEVVNRLAKLPLKDLKYACNYWYDKYRPQTEMDFYSWIESEHWTNSWNGYEPYAPALSALLKTGYYNHHKNN